MGEDQYNLNLRTMLPKNNNLDLSSMSAFWYMNEKDMIDSGRTESSVLSDCTLKVIFLDCYELPEQSKRTYSLYSGCILRSEYFRNYIEKCKGFKEETLLSLSCGNSKTKILFELVEEAPGIEPAFDIFVDLICRFFDKSEICSFVNGLSYKHDDYCLLRKTAEYCLSIKYLATKYSFPLISLLATIIYDELNVDNTINTNSHSTSDLHTSLFHRIRLQKSIAVIFRAEAIEETQLLPECIQSFHLYSSFVPFFGKILSPKSLQCSQNAKTNYNEYLLPGIFTNSFRWGKHCFHSDNVCPFCLFFQSFSNHSALSSLTKPTNEKPILNSKFRYNTLNDGYWLTRFWTLKENAKRLITNFGDFSDHIDTLKQQHISTDGDDYYSPRSFILSKKSTDLVVDNVFVFKHGMVITEPACRTTSAICGNKILSRVISTCFSTMDLFSMKYELLPNIFDLTVEFGTFDIRSDHSLIYEKYAITMKIKIETTRSNPNKVTNVVLSPMLYFERIVCGNSNHDNNSSTSNKGHNIINSFKPLRNVYIMDFYEKEKKDNFVSSSLKTSSEQQCTTSRLMSTMYNVSANEESEHGIRYSTISGFPECRSFRRKYGQFGNDGCEILGGYHKDVPISPNTNQTKSHRQYIIDFTDYGILDDHGKEKKTEIHFVLSVTHAHFGKIETSPCHVNLVKIRDIFQSNPEETMLLCLLPTINLEKLETPSCFRDKFVDKITKCLYSEHNNNNNVDHDNSSNGSSVLDSSHHHHHHGSLAQNSFSSSSSSEDVSFEYEEDITSNNINEMDYTFSENRFLGMNENSDSFSELLPKRKPNEILIQADMMWKTSA